MRHWIIAVARLYPVKWRERYGAEFHALMEDMEPSWRQFLNVLGGALKMQMLKGGAIYLKLGATFAVLGMMIAMAVSFAVPRQYIASAVLRISPSPNGQPKEIPISDQPLVSAIQIAYSRTSLSEIIRRPDLDLYKKERFRKPLEDVVGQMSHDLRIARIQSKDPGLAIRVDFLYADPRKARQVVEAVIARMAEAFASERWPAERTFQNLTILDPPTVPTQAVAPNRFVFVGFGLALGLMSGLIATFSVRKTRRAMLLTATGLAGCVIGAGLSFVIADRYISTAVIRIIPVDLQASADAARQLEQAAAQLTSNAALSELIQRPELNLYAKERSNTPLGEVVGRMRDRDLKLVLLRPGTYTGATSSGATAMEIRFEYPDRYKAQALVMAITREITHSGAKGAIEYLDSPSLPQSPVFPNRYVISALGLAFGLLVGAISLWAIGRRNPAMLVQQ